MPNDLGRAIEGQTTRLDLWADGRRADHLSHATQARMTLTPDG
jgi:hypothetical protein